MSITSQSYKVTVTGKGPLENVSCILELTQAVQMKNTSGNSWEGSIGPINVYKKLDYEIFVSAVGKVEFDYTIDNTQTSNQVEKDSSATNQNVVNGAKIRSNCNAK